jgi:outer membrane protein TolC
MRFSVTTAFLALLFSVSPASAQRVLTLDEALAMAKTANKDLRATRTRIDQARTQIEQVRSLLLPTLSAQGKYTRNSFESRLDPSQFLPPGVPAPGNLEPIVIQPFDQLDFVANANVPLVAPSAYDAYRASLRSVEAARANVKTAETQMLFTTAEAFFGAAGLDALVRARENAVQVAKTTLDNAKARLAAGVVNKVEVMRAETALVRAEQALREAQDQRSRSYDNLRLLLSTNEELIVQPVEPPPPPSESLEELVSSAELRRPEILALRKSAESARLQVRSAALRWLPTLSGFGLFRAFNYRGFLPENYVWSVGVQLDWLIYDAGRRDADRHLAAAQRMENTLRLEYATDALKVELGAARRAVGTKRRALETAQHALELARETLKLVRAQYEAGTATQLDLLVAQDNLVLSEVGVAQARFDVSTADLGLRRYAGTFP